MVRTVRSYLLLAVSQVEFARPWFPSSKIYQFLNCLKGNQHSVFSVVARLWAEWPGLRLPTGARDFSFLKNVRASSGTHSGSHSAGTGFLFSGAKRRGHEADHFLVSWLRMSGRISPGRFRTL